MKRQLPEFHFEERASARMRELDDDIDVEASALMLNFERLSNLVDADLESNVFRRFGVSYAGFRVMFAVWVFGPTEPKTIATLANVTRASISSVLNTLERDAYLVRKRESADRRLVTVELTDKGDKLVADANLVLNSRQRRWMECLSSRERVTLGRIMRRLIQHRPRHDE